MARSLGDNGPGADISLTPRFSGVETAMVGPWNSFNAFDGSKALKLFPAGSGAALRIALILAEPN
jgi:hypothetical protein